MASTSGTKSSNQSTINSNDEDGDLAVLMALQNEELMSARSAHSDLDFAFQLQMNEALAASASLSPSSSSALAFSDSPVDDDDDFAAAMEVFAEEISRLERDRANLEQWKASMRDDFQLRLHDRKVASEMFAIPDREWEVAGDHYEMPFAVGGHHGLGFDGDHSGLYFKGLVVVLDDPNQPKRGAIGVAIFDSANTVVLEVSKALLLPEMSEQVAELEAFVHGLELAVSLQLTRVVCFCVDFNVDALLCGNQKPKEAKVAELVDCAARLKKRFLSCNFSNGTSNNAELVLELARSSIAKQAGKPVKEIVLVKEKCPICLEDVDSGTIYEMVRCHHRFCSSCMQKHVEHKVRARDLPRCPQLNCELELDINACRKFLPLPMYNTVDQLRKESSIPPAEKVYCPNPRCSTLMSKNEALANIQSVAGTSRAEFTACRCVKCHLLFCINCKVLWHSNMSCDDYKKRKLDLSSSDGKLNVLAESKKWRQCPKCSHMVELIEGCNHIHCRCGHQFCYLCGREWKIKKPTCGCPLWTEENIIHGGRANG